MGPRIWCGGVFTLMLLVCSCSFDQSGLAFNDATPLGQADAARSDANVNPADANVNPADARIIDAMGCGWAYSPVFFDPCGMGTPTASPSLFLNMNGTYVYDSDAATLTAPDMTVTMPANSMVAGSRAIWFNSIVIGSTATLRVEGSLPVIVVSLGDFDVQGTVAANSFLDGGNYVSGAGANYSGCPASPPDPGAVCAQHGGSGGGGAALSGAGGNGGEGGDTRDCGAPFPDGVPGGLGGVAIGATPVNLRGGCAGRDGSQNDSGNTDFGPGAPGGGAVHLSAAATLTISGTVHAGGAGGGAGQDNRSGGGGGGSGGTVSLEALSLVVNSSAVLASNGGAGGGGCDNNPATVGQDGQASDQPATGGPSQGSGGNGGNGGADVTPDGVSAVAASRGGGGGGGGTGFILLYSPQAPMVNNSATVSPSAITP